MRNKRELHTLTQEDSDLIIILASIHHSSLLECFDNWKELCYSIYDHLLHLLQMLLDKDTWIQILADLIITPSFNYYSQIELNDNHQMKSCLQIWIANTVDLTITSTFTYYSQIELNDNIWMNYWQMIWIQVKVDLIITSSFNHYSQIELNHTDWMNRFLQTWTENSGDLIITPSLILTSKQDRMTTTEWITGKWYGFKWK